SNGVRAEAVQSDGLERVEGPFDYILTNPPIRAGKQVIYRLFAESAQKLSPEGSLYIVIRKQQGAESAVKYLKTIFQQVDTVDKSGGFWVIRCSGGKQDEV
ncbi:MAG: methyltransferase, partial [Clostridia bacterium]|nr:methyltransferase [Clostridia bacterium]